MNIEVHIHEFTDKILSNINLYKSPMDFSVLSSDSSLPPEIKRLDKSSIKVLKESIHGKKMLDRNDYITFRDIVGVALHIDTYKKSQQYSAYFKWLDERNDILDDDCESVFQHAYNNATLLLLLIITLWNNVLYIQHIVDYLIENTELLLEGTININIQDICNFIFSLYSEILALFCRHIIVSTEDVNQIAERLLSSRYYSDVYLLITGYFYDETVSYKENPYQNLKDIYRWDFTLLQNRVTPKLYLSNEDKKNFAYYPDYIVKLKSEIKELSRKLNSEEQMIEGEKEDLHNDLINKEEKYMLILKGKKIVERYRKETRI